MFLKNKYTLWYYSIVNNAKSRHLDKKVYVERHHIIPRCLGGDNDKDNIATLTAREHFICHIILTKITEGREKYMMIHAAIGMKRSRKYQKRYINSRLYETVRKEFAQISSLRNKGKKASAETRAKLSLAGKGRVFTQEHKDKISKALKGKPKGPMSDSEKLKRSVANKGMVSPNKGNKGKYKHSSEAKAKISENNRRRGISEETKRRISEGVKRRNEERRRQS